MLDEIPLSQPDLTEREIEAVVKVLRSGRLALGPEASRFEEMVAARVGAAHAVACSSGTAGLHLALVAMGVGPGDEVITTPFSFIASANAIVYTGATPVIVDIEPKSLNMDPTLVEAAITPQTKAILAVEVFGNPMHMAAYRAIADRHEIRLLEDCCEALGSRWDDKPAGGFGHAGVFGFYPNKQITAAEGGMIVTSDDRLADCARALRNHGRHPNASGTTLGQPLDHDRLGYNFRMSELHAALGAAQMRRLDELIDRRQQVAQLYIERLLDHEHVIVPTIHPRTFMSWFVFVVRLSELFTLEDRNRIIDGMHRHDVGAAAYFPCIHLQHFYRQRFGFKEGDFPRAERASRRTIALPFYPQLTERDIDFVVQTLGLMISRAGLRRA